MCGTIRADAVIADRCIGPGSRVDIVLCEGCSTPLPACFAPGVMLPPPPEDDAERAHGSRAGCPAQNATAALPSLHDLRTFTIIVDERRSGSDGLAPVKVLTRHASRCRAGQRAPRLPSRAPVASGTLYMGLGNTVTICDAPVFGKNTCVDIQGVGWTTFRLQPGHDRHGPRSFPKDSVFFPGCACARGAMIAPRGRFMRWEGRRRSGLRFGMILAG